ncbi:hypothetical protein AABB24_022340 [Solanum stoloniferum]|uniref:C2 domain-containing protein n=1 Tax=Solanum stoloniferum TaxID=62892 RepID=A0ABD2SYY8_9SOLN
MAYSSSMPAKYKLLIVEVKSAQFDVKKKGKYYVKVSTHKENQLKTSKIKMCTNQQWSQKFVFVVPSSESFSLRFEIFKAGKFLPLDSLLGVAEYRFDSESEEEESAVYDTDREYKSDSDGDRDCDEDYLSLCSTFRASESLKIWRYGSDYRISKGELYVEIELGNNPSMVGDFNWKRFGMKYKDFMMEETSRGYSGCVCFAPTEEEMHV